MPGEDANETPMDGDAPRIKAPSAIHSDGLAGFETTDLPSVDVEAGKVTGVGTNDPNTVAVKAQIHRDNARASRWLAYGLIAILAGTFSVHYALLAYLVVQGTLSAEALTDLFEKWLPVLTGFTGSAVTYFLTRER